MAAFQAGAEHHNKAKPGGETGKHSPRTYAKKGEKRKMKDGFMGLMKDGSQKETKSVGVTPLVF